MIKPPIRISARVIGSALALVALLAAGALVTRSLWMPRATAAAKRMVHLARAAGGGSEARAQERPKASPVALAPGRLQLTDVEPRRYRLILDAAARERLRRSATQRTDAWRRIEAHCHGHLARNTRGGYQGQSWAGAIGDLCLCWHATGEAKYARRAIDYLRALLDDRFDIGDGKGGVSVVTHDIGYGMRNFAVFTALGYDWLHDAPGMTAELRRRMVDRLESWIDWYSREGYQRDRPISNYFWGYLTATTLAGLAVAGTAPEGDAFLAHARELWEQRVLPEFSKLEGGDWPEGWQYGEVVAAQAALLTKAFDTAAGVDLLPKLPWVKQVVRHHAHALLPDTKTVYGGGTWNDRPSRPSSLALLALSVALNEKHPDLAAEARFMATRLTPDLPREFAWFSLLADDPKGKLIDPRRGARSYHARGTGLTLMRSDWTGDAVFASFKLGPRLALDHQDADEGHFELWRGSDPLLIDAGDIYGSGTINHNSLLIDDAGRLLEYPPNQGRWGTSVRTSRFADDGEAVVVAGDFAESYAPKCARDGCTDRLLDRAERTLVYLRPNVLVVRDRVALKNAGDGVRFILHTAGRAHLEGRRATAEVGTSRVSVDSLLPNDAKRTVVAEPTPTAPSKDELWTKNRVWTDSYRLEVDSPRGAEQREFLHVAFASARGRSPAKARYVSGSGLDGALVESGGRSVAVLFADSAGGGNIEVPGASRILVVGLTPNRTYRIRTTSKAACAIEIDASGSGATRTNAAGALRVAGCQE